MIEYTFVVPCRVYATVRAVSVEEALRYINATEELDQEGAPVRVGGRGVTLSIQRKDEVTIQDLDGVYKP